MGTQNSSAGTTKSNANTQAPTIEFILFIGLAIAATGLIFFILLQPHLSILGFLLLEIGCGISAAGGWNKLNNNKTSNEIDGSTSTLGSNNTDSNVASKNNFYPSLLKSSRTTKNANNNVNLADTLVTSEKHQRNKNPSLTTN